MRPGKTRPLRKGNPQPPRAESPSPPHNDQALYKALPPTRACEQSSTWDDVSGPFRHTLCLPREPVLSSSLFKVWVSQINLASLHGVNCHILGFNCKTVCCVARMSAECYLQECPIPENKSDLINDVATMVPVSHLFLKLQDQT